MPAEDIKVLPLSAGPLVLVVEDEATPRATLTRWIDALGYQVRSCPSGPAALRFLKAHPRKVRLLLTDLAMPLMDGGELVERGLAMPRMDGGKVAERVPKNLYLGAP